MEKTTDLINALFDMHSLVIDFPWRICASTRKSFVDHPQAMSVEADWILGPPGGLVSFVTAPAVL